ncbi:hypothetical protein DFQ26_001986 [Actinomortierella ambigua]|nr:hypothetical protein DFQ26_001986 [Actinomortierella ambigua]
MAPLRALLSSRAVLAGLAALGCLALFMNTMDSHYTVSIHKSQYQPDNTHNYAQQSGGRDSGHASTQWIDAHSPAQGLGPGLGVNPGRQPLTIQAVLERAETYYQRILRQRQQWLTENKFGTSAFDPWFVLMYWWWYFPASYVCPHDIQRVGPLSDGGKWLCGMSLYEEKPRAKCIIYSFGVNHETRFEGEMLDRTDCEIWAYDASVSRMGPETDGRPKVHFEPVFVGSEDKIGADGKVWKTLKTIMKENGHDWIDILKIDIEGSEYATLGKMMDDFPDVLPFSQLQLELHVHESHISFPDFLTWWQRLEGKGIRPWWTEINLNPTYSGQRAWASEYCFINTRGGAKNVLIQNY